MLEDIKDKGSYKNENSLNSKINIENKNKDENKGIINKINLMLAELKY